MNIHQMLQQVTQAGEVLTYSEIIEKVLIAYPDAKASSILPSEHTKGRQGTCKRCYLSPIFEKVGHGLYRVLPVRLEVSRLSVHQKLQQALESEKGEMLSVEAIRQAVLQMFPDTHGPSVIPGDHAFGGACRICAHSPLLERASVRGYYRVRGDLLEIEQFQDFKTVQELARLIKARSPLLLHQQSNWLESELRNSTSLKNRDINLLMSVLRERMLLDLIEFGALLPTEVIQQRLAQRLYDQQGISLPLAHWAIQVWHQALQLASRASFAERPKLKRVAESPGFWLVLTHLQAIQLTPHITLLKKKRRRLAIYLKSDDSWLFGVRQELLTPSLEKALQAVSQPLSDPPQLTIGQFQHFSWHHFKLLEQLQRVIQQLDDSLGG